MSSAKFLNKTWIAGLLTALGASICCIGPLLTLLSGLTGFAASFIWIERYRPVLICLSIVCLCFAWYQQLQPTKKEAECGCEGIEKSSFWQTKTFLGIITLFALCMIAFPLYADRVYAKKEMMHVQPMPNSSLQEMTFTIRGMACLSCEKEIDAALSKVVGVRQYRTFFGMASSIVLFDANKVRMEDIINAINKTGYKVTSSSSCCNKN